MVNVKSKKKLKYKLIWFIIENWKKFNIGLEMRLKTGAFKYLVIIIFAQSLFLGLWALDPAKRCEQYLVDKWDISDGIPSNTILSMAQTPDGYLWFGTFNGLVRFDGKKFSIIDFSEKNANSPDVRSLFVDKQGNLLVGSSIGLIFYNYHSGDHKIFKVKDGIEENRIRRIKKDNKGNVWISYESGFISRLSKGRFTAYNESHGLSGKKINAIIEDRQGNLIFASREDGIFMYKDGKFSKYPIQGLDDRQIVTMYKDNKGNLWVGTDKGLCRATGKKTEIYTIRDGLADEYITGIIEDSDGNLWAGTLGGLNRIKINEDETISFDNILTRFKIFSIFEDREKSLWIGTYNSGIKRLKDAKFHSYEPLMSHGDKVFLSLFRDRRGHTWAGTFSGELFICQNDGNQDDGIIDILKPDKITGTGIAAIAEDAEKNPWFGTNGKGVFQKKGRRFIQFTTDDGLSDNQVTSIFKDSRGNLWFGTFNGLSVYRYPGGDIKSFKHEDGLCGKRVYNVYEDKNNNIWIAADKGIAVFKKGYAGTFFEKKSSPPDVIMPGVPVTCIHEDLTVPEGEGAVFWIATDGSGLKRLKLKGKEKEVISFTKDDGLATNYIYQFIEDKQGYFWLTSKHGILRIAKSELNRFAAGGTKEINCVSFGIEDGMRSSEFNNEFSRHSIMKTRDGEFRFITRKDISIANPGNMRFNKALPPVVIERISYDGQSIVKPRNSKPHTFRGKKEIAIYFNALTFLTPDKARFRYQLDFSDKKWKTMSPGEERVARYRELPWGTYTFKVIACNAEGVWNYAGASTTFTLKPIFYQTLFFKIILIVFAVLFFTLSILRKKHPREKKGHEPEALAMAARHGPDKIEISNNKSADAPGDGIPRDKFVHLPAEKEEQIKEKYQGTPLNRCFVEETTRKLDQLAVNEKVYCDDNITLQKLADKLKIHPHKLSRILNEHIGHNFSDYINFHRINEAKAIMVNHEGFGKKIITVAHEVGFKSMTAFYNAFKKYTGITPKQFKKQIGKGR